MNGVVESGSGTPPALEPSLEVIAARARPSDLSSLHPWTSQSNLLCYHPNRMISLRLDGCAQFVPHARESKPVPLYSRELRCFLTDLRVDRLTNSPCRSFRRATQNSSTCLPDPFLCPGRRQRQFVVGSGPEAVPGLFRAVRCEPPSLTLRRPDLHMTWLYFLD